MSAVFKDPEEAQKQLLKLGFMKRDDQYLGLCSRMLVFLCDGPGFEKALGSVSAFIWSHYTGLNPATKNKFSRSLAHVATQNMFRVSTRPALAPHPDQLQMTSAPSPGTMDIKLVASYGDFFGLLRERMFWKDSMDMEHGEYSHALQWLALAFEFGPLAATFYSKLPDYECKIKGKDEPMYLWSYLADCFPDTKKADAELISNTYRSPNMIMKHLIGRSKPIEGHFVSHYLTYVYKQRNLVSYQKNEYGTKANYGSASSQALDQSRAKQWVAVTETPKGSQPRVTRLDRDPLAAPKPASKQQGAEFTFHGIKGTLWTKGDWNNLYD